MANRFLKNCWYVAAWSHELGDGAMLGRKIIGEPVMLARRPDGSAFALADRCSHRRAPLSLGRIEEGCVIRCMYHGLRFDDSGKCLSVPGTDTLPPNTSVRSYPVIEQHSWLWVWMGDPQKADPALVPEAFGLDDPQWTMRADQLDYAAHYELVNDNLCDLSHVDFVHETTLGHVTGGGWAEAMPTIKPHERSVRFERWFVAKPASPTNPMLVDTWSAYTYHVPGIFVMENRSYKHGEAEACGFKEPTREPMTRRIEQQAVTPISESSTRYFYATGFDSRMPSKLLDPIFDVIMATFAEDKTIIEAQQRIWDATPPDMPMAFIPQDKAPAMMRQILKKLIAAENEPTSA